MKSLVTFAFAIPGFLAAWLLFPAQEAPTPGVAVGIAFVGAEGEMAYELGPEHKLWAYVSTIGSVVRTEEELMTVCRVMLQAQSLGIEGLRPWNEHETAMLIRASRGDPAACMVLDWGQE
jgi:hypothetical protein